MNEAVTNLGQTIVLKSDETSELMAKLELLAGDKTAEALRIAIAGIKNGITADELDEAVHLWGSVKWRGFDVQTLRPIMDRELREQLRVSQSETTPDTHLNPLH